MKKSFKRVLACFLAVLMVMFAMPFSALAYSADETGNWGLVFNAFTMNTKYYGSGSFTADANNLNLRGVKDTPLDWDQTNKTLTLTTAKVLASAYDTGQSASAQKRYDVSKGDYNLKAGDYFTVTFCLENVQTIFGAGVQFEWTGCEPADVYQYSYENDDGDLVTKLTLLDEDHCTTAANLVDDGYDVTFSTYAPKGLPVADLSAGTGYTALANVDNTNGHSYFGTYANFGITADGVDYVDISHFNTQGSGANRAKNPETGANQYAWDYRAPLGTYLFKVTDPTNISFAPNDPTAPGGTFYATDINHTVPCYDYGIQTDMSTGQPLDLDTWGMNFNGTNTNNSTPVVTYPTVTITTPDGYQDFSYTADAQTTTYPVPNLADYTKAPDSTNHYAAQWKDGVVPSGTFAATNESFEIEFAATAHTFGEAVVDPAPTCTTEGTATYTCPTCNYSYTEPVAIDNNAHNWGAWAADDSTWATTTDQTVEANNSATVTFKRTCANNASHTESDVVNATVSAFTAATENAAGSVTFTATKDGVTATKTVELAQLQHTHNYATLQEIPNTRTAATCSAYATYQTAMYCACGEYDQSTVDTVTDTAAGYDFSNHVNEVNVPAKAATCTVAGNYAYSYCDACGKYYMNGQEVQAADTVIAALNHDFTGPIDISWAETNQTGAGRWIASGVQHCTRCTETTEVAVTTNYSHQDATPKTAGYDKWEAVVNGNVEDSKTEVIAAEGINITVTKTDLGSVDGDIVADGAEVTKAFAFGTKYTIRAVRPTGATFLGWKINEKIVSTSETYSAIAYTDTTITPVFQETADANKINVFFYDKYGNIIKAFENKTVEEYQSAVVEAVPAGPSYPGYTFKGYDKSDDIIKANDKSATYWAQYEKDAEAATYTVSAPGATISAPAGNVDGSTATNVPYDTKVTVSAEGAAAWKIGDAIVAYGSEYSFFVGSDVEVVPVAEAEIAPNVAIIGQTQNGNSFTVTATRTNGNASIVERGWIYGAVSEAALANLDTAKAAGARQIRTATSSTEQFALTFNIKNAGTTVRARAFIVDNHGEVYYSAAIATCTK